MPTDFLVNAYYLGSLSGDAGKEGSSVTPTQITFTDVNDDGVISEGEDELQGITVETMKDQSILELEGAGTVVGWYVEIEINGEKDAYFIPTDGTVPENDTLDEDVDLQGSQSGDIDDIMVVPCFTKGSLIKTIYGDQPVETLAPGDLVATLDCGLQEVRWVAQRQFSSAEIAVFQKLRPVVIKRGSLGEDTPSRDLIVSPNHRVLLSDFVAEYYLGEPEVLVAAKHLVGRPGIRRLPPTEITYVHIMFDQHQLVHSDGAWTESFCPGPQILKGFGRAQTEELFAIFPELRGQSDQHHFQLARMELKKREIALWHDL